MKDIILSETEIPIKPEVKELWLKITGTYPIKYKYKTEYDTSNPKELEIIRLTVAVQCNPYSTHEHWKFKSVTDNTWNICAFENPLQYKKEIFRLWVLLHERLLEKVDFSCCICGVKMKQAEFLPGVGWFGGLRSNNNNWTVCYHSSGCEKKGEYCTNIRERMAGYLRKLINRINRLEQKATCNHCNKEYIPKRKDSLFCSIKCRVANFRKKEKGGSAADTSIKAD